jgi:uncharacterized protein (TIGR03435 family)
MLFVFSAAAVWPQTPAFEVASIKPAAPMERGKMLIGFGGDAGRINYTNVSLKDVVARAYEMKPYQVSGPSWMDSERYDITAKIPDGVPREKVPEMLQNLLIERFKMTVHKESKEQAIYALIAGKNGPRLTESAEGDASAVVGPDGAKFAAPRGGVMIDGSGKIRATRTTMGGFADMLSRLMDRPVVDMTGLKGTYDLTLEVAMEDLVGMKKMAERAGPGAHLGGDGGPAPDGDPHASMFSAVQQLGLKLDARKSPLDFLVVDKAEKAATEN